MICKRCATPFAFLDGYCNLGPKAPVLLTCGHNICVGCAKTLSKIRHEIRCPGCEVVTTFPPGNSGVIDFPIDKYAVGSLLLLQKNRKKQGFSINMKVSIPQSESSFSATDEKCDECNSGLAILACVNCTVKFCHNCFVKTHSGSLTLGKHQVQPLESSNRVTRKPDLCEFHHQVVEFFCKNDDMKVCSHCLLPNGKHASHNVVPLSEKNEAALAELSTGSGHMTKMCTYLFAAEKKMKDYLPKVKASARDETQLIKTTFSFAHGLLQVRENLLECAVNRKVENHEKYVKHAIEEVEITHKKLKGILSDIESYKADKALAGIESLVMEVDSAKGLPCRLENPLVDVPKNVDMNQSVIPYIQSWGTILNDPVKENLKLSTITEGASLEGIPEDMLQAAAKAVAPSPKLAVLTASDYMKMHKPLVSASTNSDKSQNDYPMLGYGKETQFKPRCQYGASSSGSEVRHVLHAPPAPPSPPRPKEWKPFQQDQVILLHSMHPAHFYVMLVSSKPYMDNLHQEIQKYKARYNDEPCCAADVVKGQLGLARVGPDNVWRRVKVLDVIGTAVIFKPNNDGNKDQRCAKPLAEANNNCADGDSDASTAEFDEAIIDGPPSPSAQQQTIGERELSIKIFQIDVGASEIIPISRLQKIPMKFSEPAPLAFCCGLADVESIDGFWLPEANVLFTRYCANKTVFLTVIEKSDLKLEVELGHILRFGVNDTPGSVRAALVFHGLAKYTCSIPRYPDRTLVKKNYHKPELPIVGTSLEVNVVSVEHPECFYAYQAHNNANEVDHFMKMVETIGKFYENLNDVEDWAMYNPRIGMPCVAKYDEKSWQRAIVQDLPGNRQLDVQFVDFGGSRRIPSSDVRRMNSEFLVIPPQAFKCGLVDVQPISDCWSEEARADLVGMVDGKTLRMFVIGMSGDKLAVSLLRYFAESKEVVSISSQLVLHGHALSCGISEEHMVSAYRRDMRTVDKSSGEADTVVNKPSTSKGPQCPANYIPVTVTYTRDPSEIYIQVDDRKSDFLRMMTKLQEWYSIPRVVSRDHKWTKGDFCAAYDKDKSKWYRCKIKKIKPAELFEVWAFDFGFCMSVKREDVRVLDDRFLEDDAYACKCHLSDVIPAGGSDRWPTRAVDFVKDRFEETPNVFLHQAGPIVGGSLPVDLYTRKTTAGGALEPYRTIFESTCREIVLDGAAIPQKRIKLEPGNEPVKVEAEVSPPKPTVSKVVLEPPPAHKWLEPIQPNRAHRKCNVYPTHVDEDGIIYLHDEAEESHLRLISDALTAKFENTSPAPNDLYWFKDDCCAGLFSDDCKWHRVRVLSVESDGVEVFFIDYGNIETLKPGHLRKSPFFADVPQLCWPCKLYGIEPKTDDALWPREVLNYLHTTIVPKLCEMEVSVPPKGKYLMEITLKLQTGEDLGQLLVSQGHALVHVPDNDSQLEDMDISNDDDEEDIACADGGFDELPELMLPPVDEIFPIIAIQAGVSPDLVLVQRMLVDSPLTEYQKQIKEHMSFFSEMCDILNNKAPSWPVIEDIRPGTSCCTMYSKDNNWFRAVVLHVYEPTENPMCQVQFVDYGNIEMVSTKLIKVLPKDLLHFPRQHICCKLHQVVPSAEEGWSEKLLQKFSMIWNDPPGDLFAHVKVSSYPIEADIFYHSPDGNSHLAYEHLIDAGLVRLVRAV